LRESELKQHRAKLQGDLRKVKDHLNGSGTTGVSSEIESSRILANLGVLLDTMRALRGEADFWTRLPPSYRVRFEDLQGDLAALRAAYRK
jgi:hypothetical protein